MKRISLAFVLSILTLNTALAAPQIVRDSYWYEIKELTKDGHNPLTEYERSREYLMQEIYIQKDSQGFYVNDVYCGIKYRKKVSPRTMPNHNELNVEHTWPQSRFNKRENRAFQKSDLHHLFPSDSKANGKRGNLPFGEFKSGRSATPNCALSRYGRIDEARKNGFEPPANHKGNVARALFYFSLRYDLRIKPYEEMVLRQWNILDPVDSEEVRRNTLIEKIQGNRNPFIDDSELVNLISDF